MIFILPENKKLAVISDLHIGSDIEDLRVLDSILANADYVIFNGDIFELYVHRWEKLLKKNKRAKKIYELLKSNKGKYFYIVGNHDDAIRDEDNLGVDLYSSINVISNGKSICVIHGHQFDNINRDAPWWVHPLVKLEHAWNKLFNTNIQKNLIQRTTTFSSLSKKKKEEYLKGIREKAQLFVKKGKFDALVYGHTHIPVIQSEVPIEIVDEGSFVIGVSYLEIQNGKLILKVVKDVR